jgi:RNA polymerase sigma-70 factor (ECF subfamily)
VNGGLAVDDPGPVASRDERLADLFRAESARAVRLAFLLTGQRQLAEDLAQDAFLRIAGRLRSVDPDSFAAYYRQTLINLVRSHHRHARVRRRYADRIEADARRVRDVVERASVPNERDDRLWNALAALPPGQRETIVCRYYLDLSEQQTAEVLGVRPGTVKSATSRGLQTLRAALEREEVS